MYLSKRSGYTNCRHPIHNPELSKFVQKLSKIHIILECMKWTHENIPKINCKDPSMHLDISNSFKRIDATSILRFSRTTPIMTDIKKLTLFQDYYSLRPPLQRHIYIYIYIRKSTQVQDYATLRPPL